jgi:hypothetical protein
VRSVVNVTTTSVPTSEQDAESRNRPGVTASIERVVDPARGDHYGGMKMQPLEFILANDLDFLTGNVVKYVTRGVDPVRALRPGAQRLIDLHKARHYLDLLIQREGRVS